MIIVGCQSSLAVASLQPASPSAALRTGVDRQPRWRLHRKTWLGPGNLKLIEEGNRQLAATLREALDLFDALASAGYGPLVLTIDDLHWADRPTLDLITAVGVGARLGQDRQAD